MKKALALLLVAFMVLGAKLALADTRTDSLGLTAGQQVDDVDSIWLFPQDAANFGNIVDVRMGDPNGPTVDWGGIIHKDFDDVGYIGVYYNRPFNTSNGILPNTQAANQNGILNGWTNWDNMLNPNNSNYSFPFTPDNTENPYYPWTPYSSNDTLGAEVNWQFPTGFSQTTVADPSNTVDLFWAKDFADATLGLRVSYASQDGNDNGQFGDGSGNYTQGTPTLDNQTNSTFKSSSSVIGLDLGATLKNLGNNMSLALGLGYSLGMVDYEENYNQNYLTAGTQTTYFNDVIKDKGIDEIRVNALLKNKVSDTLTARVYGNARLDSLGFSDNAKYDNSGDGTFGDQAREIYSGSSSYTDNNINLGVACEHTVADGKAKVIAGIELINDGRKWTYTALTNLAGSTTPDQVRWGSGSSYTEDWWVVPFNVAIEAPLFDWLTGRMGIGTALYNTVNSKDTYLRNANGAGTAYTDSTSVSNTVNWPQALNLSYGVSAKFNNLTLDLQVNPGALLNYAQNFAPGQGILYGSNGNAAQAGSSPSQLFGTLTQADMRYAF